MVRWVDQSHVHAEADEVSDHTDVVPVTEQIDTLYSPPPRITSIESSSVFSELEGERVVGPMS